MAIIHQGRIIREGKVSQLLSGGAGHLRLSLSPISKALEILQPKFQANKMDLSDPGGIGWIQIETTPDAAPGIIRQLVEARIDIHQVLEVKQSLEDLFLEVTGKEDVVMNNRLGPFKAEWIKIARNYKFNSFLVWILPIGMAAFYTFMIAGALIVKEPSEELIIGCYGTWTSSAAGVWDFLRILSWQHFWPYPTPGVFCGRDGGRIPVGNMEEPGPAFPPPEPAL